MEALSSAIEDLGDPPTDPSVISIPKFEDLVEPLHDFESTQDEIVELESLDPINEKEDLCPNGSDSKEPVKTMTVETCSEISRENPSLDLSDSCKEIGFSSDSIEQELGMVSLVGDAEEESKSKEVVKTEKDIYCVSDAESGEIKSSSDSDSDSDSESDSDSDSSSSSSSSDGDEEDDSDDTDDDDEGDQEEEDEKINGDDDDEREKSDMDVTGDVEEGEIRGFDIEEIVGCSDDEEEIGVIKGPIKSKNEVEILPPVPPVNAALEPHHSTLPVGVILSMMGTKVVIEGLEKHNPLNEGSILWITESRAPLGMIDEIFGPVKNPYYVVRFNSVEEIPTGIHEGVTISYVEEFSNHVLNEKDLYKKGYDASGDNDEAVFDEVEFSDDEKEAEYRRSQRMAKRGPNDRKNGNREFVDRKHGNQEFMDRKRVQVLDTGELHKSIQPLGPGPGPPQAPSHLHMMQPATGQMGCGDCACSFNAGPNGMGGPVMVPSMSHMAQSSGFLGCPPQQLLPQHNTVWTNGIPAQQHHMGMLIPPNAFQMNGMPCLQQPDQIFNGFPNAMPCQQHFDPSQIPSHGLMLPGGQMNFPMGGPPATWQGPIGQGGFNQAQPFGMGLQGSVSLPQQFNPGAASFRGKRPYWPYSRGRGGNFSGGGRGRHQTR